jgi:hypothetical protein
MHAETTGRDSNMKYLIIAIIGLIVGFAVVFTAIELTRPDIPSCPENGRQYAYISP